MSITTLSDTVLLNSNHQDPNLPKSSDVVVVGAGIHSLIYAIHAKKIENLGTLHGDHQGSRTITVLEKAASPGYKIGESTLTVFGLWLKTIGIDAPLLWRLFGPKDGLAFYYLGRNDDPEDYTSFAANGPPGDFVPTLQIERKISELLLTLFAQRLGVKVMHGHSVDIDGCSISDNSSTIRVKDIETDEEREIAAKLVVDATGRFRRFASKESRIKRLDDFNTSAFWAYFECPGDESDISFDHYESCFTNHICLPEGWAWVIRLPSWEGSSVPNLMRMINHLLDLNEKKTPGDEFPSAYKLAEMFDLKFRWVVSIGFALRSDVVYPEDLSSYGSCEAERKFTWIVSRYSKMQNLMDQHVLIKDLYGPKSTWFIRKNLTYQSPKVSGKGWIAIGDAVGFTNPLYSPGINASMGTSIYAAELTSSYISSRNSLAREEILGRYNEYCQNRIPNLHLMTKFNYLCMRSPKLGPLGPLWTYLCGTGNANFQKIKTFELRNVSDMLMNWDWGSQEPEFINFASQVIKLLEGPPTEPSQEIIDQVLLFSEESLRSVVAAGKFNNRWAGLLRWYDDDLVFHDTKTWKDVLSRRCNGCRNWRILHSDMLKCAFCGEEHTAEESKKVLVEAMPLFSIPDLGNLKIQTPESEFEVLEFKEAISVEVVSEVLEVKEAIPVEVISADLEKEMVMTVPVVA